MSSVGDRGTGQWAGLPHAFCRPALLACHICVCSSSGCSTPLCQGSEPKFPGLPGRQVECRMVCSNVKVQNGHSGPSVKSPQLLCKGPRGAGPEELTHPRLLGSTSIEGGLFIETQWDPQLYPDLTRRLVKRPAASEIEHDEFHSIGLTQMPRVHEHQEAVLNIAGPIPPGTKHC